MKLEKVHEPERCQLGVRKAGSGGAAARGPGASQSLFSGPEDMCPVGSHAQGVGVPFATSSVSPSDAHGPSPPLPSAVTPISPETLDRQSQWGLRGPTDAQRGGPAWNLLAFLMFFRAAVGLPQMADLQALFSRFLSVPRSVWPPLLSDSSPQSVLDTQTSCFSVLGL